VAGKRINSLNSSLVLLLVTSANSKPALAMPKSWTQNLLRLRLRPLRQWHR
jgi:hypothetical protein